jgi:hypothetical protein
MRYIIGICLVFLLVITVSNYLKDQKQPHKAKAKTAAAGLLNRKNIGPWALAKAKVVWKNIKKKLDKFYSGLNAEFGGVLKSSTYKEGTRGFAHEYKPYFPEKQKE